MSPRELLEAVETDNYQLVASCGATSPNRAAKAIIALKDADLGSIATVAVEGHVTFSLLDGADLKDIADLSTGQRCTVVLPLVLRHTDRLLIVDQPEDHIDNGFIVDTLIRSVLARPADGQILFSTHNANIPCSVMPTMCCSSARTGSAAFRSSRRPWPIRRWSTRSRRSWRAVCRAERGSGRGSCDSGFAVGARAWPSGARTRRGRIRNGSDRDPQEPQARNRLLCPIRAAGHDQAADQQNRAARRRS